MGGREAKSSPRRDIPETIPGGRVRLETLRPDHAPAFWDAVDTSRHRLEPWLRWPRDVQTLADADARIVHLKEEWAGGRRLNWGIFGGERDGLLGEVAVVAADWDGGVFELGYWLRPDAEGRGLASEAVALVVRTAFEQLDANRVVLRVEAGNERSRRLAERLGFVLEGTLRRERLGLSGLPVDVLGFALVVGNDLTRVIRASAGVPPGARAPWGRSGGTS